MTATAPAPKQQRRRRRAGRATAAAGATSAPDKGSRREKAGPGDQGYSRQNGPQQVTPGVMVGSRRRACRRMCGRVKTERETAEKRKQQQPGLRGGRAAWMADDNGSQGWEVGAMISA